MTNPPNIDAIIAELSERDREMLDEMYLCGGETDWLRPLDCGGCDGSDHSYRMSKLARMGVAEFRDRGSLGKRRGSKIYRLTPLGLAVRSALIGEVGRDG